MGENHLGFLDCLAAWFRPKPESEAATDDEAPEPRSRVGEEFAEALRMQREAIRQHRGSTGVPGVPVSATPEDLGRTAGRAVGAWESDEPDRGSSLWGESGLEILRRNPEAIQAASAEAREERPASRPCASPS